RPVANPFPTSPDNITSSGGMLVDMKFLILPVISLGVTKPISLNFFVADLCIFWVIDLLDAAFFLEASTDFNLFRCVGSGITVWPLCNQPCMGISCTHV